MFRLKEIKCKEDQVPDEMKLKDYHPYWCSTEGGRGGVALLSRKMPYNVDFNIGDAEMDEEGRIITADYTKFYLVCVYVPNAGRRLVNLERRLRWNKLFEAHVNKLKQSKPVIICGDMNVSHHEIGKQFVYNKAIIVLIAFPLIIYFDRIIQSRFGQSKSQCKKCRFLSRRTCWNG